VTRFWYTFGPVEHTIPALMWKSSSLEHRESCLVYQRLRYFISLVNVLFNSIFALFTEAIFLGTASFLGLFLAENNILDNFLQKERSI
jgi:hypothetical protein